MSKAYKCDRCGSVFDFVPTAIDSLVLGTLSNVDKVEVNYHTFSWSKGINEEKKIVNYSANLVDLCPKCLDSLAEWFNGHAGEGDEDG